MSGLAPTTVVLNVVTIFAYEPQAEVPKLSAPLCQKQTAGRCGVTNCKKLLRLGITQQRFGICTTRELYNYKSLMLPFVFEQRWLHALTIYLPRCLAIIAGISSIYVLNRP